MFTYIEFIRILSSGEAHYKMSVRISQIQRIEFIDEKLHINGGPVQGSEDAYEKLLEFFRSINTRRQDPLKSLKGHPFRVF